MWPTTGPCSHLGGHRFLTCWPRDLGLTWTASRPVRNDYCTDFRLPFHAPTWCPMHGPGVRCAHAVSWTRWCEKYRNAALCMTAGFILLVTPMHTHSRKTPGSMPTAGRFTVGNKAPSPLHILRSRGLGGFCGNLIYLGDKPSLLDF